MILRLLPGLLVGVFAIAGVGPGWAAAIDERSASERLTDLEANDARLKATEAELRKKVPDVVQAGPIDPARYIVGPGDVLELDLWGPLTRNLVAVVSPEGTVLFPGTGPIKVSGRTLAWTRQTILKLVADTFRGVRAEVRLIHLRTFKVFLVGFVKRSGPMVVTSVTRASEVVNEVGTEPGASRRNIEIRRLDGTRARLDLDAFDLLGRQEADPTLVDGDVIVVPRGLEFASISGGVGRQGRYERAPDDSLSTLLRLGAGLLPSAIVERALLVRFPTPTDRESVWVDLRKLQRGEEDIPLRDGDHLFVSSQAGYHQLHAVNVIGEVERPGVYPIVLGRDRFSDLIRWAGGFRPFANQSSVYLLRETGAGIEIDPEFDRLARLSRTEMTESEYTKFQTKLAERKNSFRLDWSRIQNASSDIDPLLQPGDVVRVDQLVSTVRIEGQVRRPGFVDYAPGRGLKEYVELAGGFTDRASRRDVSVSRTLTGQVIPARSLASIQSGDFVWVPEKRDVDAWAVFRDVVGVAGQVALLIFTLSR